MKTLIALLLIFFVPLAYSGETTLTWQLPTGTEQCTAATLAPVIASTEVWQMVAQGGPTDTTAVLTGLEPGDYTYITSVTDTAGLVSRLSNAATKTIDTLLVADNRAYTVVQSGGNFVAFVIGTVPVGTVCDAGSMVRGQFNFGPFTGYGVPVADVTITGDTEPVMVVATCR